MKVILVKTVEKLGQEGQVVDVKGGYARNYLIPQGLALLAVKENYKKLDEIKRRKEKQAQVYKQEFQEFKDKLEGISLTLTTPTGATLVRIQPPWRG